MAKLALTMALLQVRYRHMPPRALKILFVILSCWAIRQWGYFSIAAADNSTTITIPVALTGFCGFAGITPNNAADQQLGLSSISGNQMVIKKGTKDSTARTGRWVIVGK